MTDQDIKADFLHGMSHAASTVNVVTTDGVAGRSGITVSAMCSVSADTVKPTLLVCINDASSGVEAMIKNGVFCVNILRDHQSFVSDTFAGRYGDKGAAKFKCGEWQNLVTGAPALTDALVSFDCVLTKDVTIGTHHVFFGEVQTVKIAESGSPLIYANRDYGTPFKLPRAALDRSASKAKDEVVRLSCLHSLAPYFLPAMMRHFMQIEGGPAIEIIEGDQTSAMKALSSQDAELAIIYDIDVPQNLSVQRLTELKPYILLPADHPLAQKEEISLRELADEPMVMLDTPASYDYFMSIFASVDIEPTIEMRTASLELVRSMVANGAGFALQVTRPSANASYDGKPLAQVKIADQIESLNLVLAKHKDTELSANARGLTAYIVDYFSNRSSK